VGLATVVAALVLLVAAPREWLGPALAGLVPLAVFMAYRLWQTHRQGASGPDNVRIDDAGVHWVDAAGRQQAFPRENVLAFHMGRDEDTMRQVPALTLYLVGGFESQPIELHSPATPEAVRTILEGGWQLQPRLPSETNSYDRTVAVYSECHEEHHEWHWEGTAAALAELFSLMRQAAEELPPPPAGAKPAQWIILAQRRQPARLRLQHAAAPYLEHDVIGGPAALLREIAFRADEVLNSASPSDDAKFDVQTGRREVWTFHLHVREA